MISDVISELLFIFYKEVDGSENKVDRYDSDLIPVIILIFYILFSASPMGTFVCSSM